jgi:hypothetical protein
MKQNLLLALLLYFLFGSYDGGHIFLSKFA